MSTSNLNPNVVKTALDMVFQQNFDTQNIPGRATALTPSVFNQETADSSAVITEIFKGSGLWENKGEEQDVPTGSVQVGNNQVFYVSEFAKSIDVPRTFQADAKFGVVNKLVKDMAINAIKTRDRNAFGIFRNAFTTTVFKTNDGAALVSSAHKNLNGDTITNKLTTALTEVSLNNAIVLLAEMKAQDGVVTGSVPATLLVPPRIYKLACEITKSTLRSGTPNNDANVYSDIYQLEVLTSPYLGLASGGSDTAWFLLGRNHSINRWVREAIWTTVVDWKYQRNNNYIYKGGFREVIGALDYVDVVGSDGTA